MTEMKLGQALKLRELFLSLSKEKVNINTAYKMYRFVKKVETENLGFYSGRIREICDKYAETLPSGQIKVSKENQPPFNQAVQELENIEVEVAAAEFSIEELAGVKISLEDMAILEPLLNKENDGANQ